MEEMDIRLGTILEEDGIVADILLRQSVKCLLRLKCVSKSWYSFISTNKFVKAHLKKSEHNTSFLISEKKKHKKTHSYVIDHYPVDWLFRAQGMIALPSRLQPVQDAGQQNIDEAASVRFGFDCPVSNLKPRVIGCCNGLCCMLIDDDIILWNPSIRKSYKLPALPENMWINTSVWFGYDEPNHDFKVLRQVGDVFNLYSLKTNSWKTLDNLFGRYPYIGCGGVLVNNTLHWVRETCVDYIACQILAFNFEMEAAELVEQPSSPLFTSLSLAVLQGCLCALGNGEEVWIMKEYGVKESWCRLATIPNFSGFPDNVFFCPLWVWDDGKILFRKESSQYDYNPEDNLESSLYVYNPTDNSIRNLEISNFTGRLHDIGFYIQSLVSPFPDKENMS